MVRLRTHLLGLAKTAANMSHTKARPTNLMDTAAYGWFHAARREALLLHP
jgi:hypothetical protein